jgi:hypothetical protein
MSDRTGPPTSDGVYVVKLEQYGDCVVERRDGYYYENGQCLATKDCDILAHRPHVPLQPYDCKLTAATARIAELEAKVGRLEIENHNLRSCMRSCATVAEDDDALQAESAALPERIRGIECRHNISSDRRSEPLRQVFEQGYDAALHAAAALVKQVKQPKGDE